jgi:uncharacterized protein (TIGR02246 family)
MIGAMIATKATRTAFEALNNRDFEAFLASWVDDATFIYPGNLSVSGEFQGKPAIEAWFRRFLEQYPQVRFMLRSVAVQNIFDLTGTNVVMAEWDFDATNREGTSIKNSGVTVIDVRRGRGVRVKDYIFDHDALKKGWGE